MLPKCLKKYQTPADQQLKLTTARREGEGSQHRMHHCTALPRPPEPKAGLSKGEVMGMWHVHGTLYHIISEYLVTQAIPARSPGKPRCPQSPIRGCQPVPHPRGYLPVTVSSSPSPRCMARSVPTRAFCTALASWGCRAE